MSARTTDGLSSSLIDGLEVLGVAAPHREALHALRIAYNEAKHNPMYEAPIQPVIDILINTKAGVGEIARLRLGDSDQPANAVTRRLLWFAAWDHYVGGDTEVSIFSPCSLDIDFPPDIELIYLKMEDWDTVKSELAAAGKLCLGRGCLPAKFFEFWSKEGDFLDAGSFEGDLRDMIAVFVRHERVEDIFPFLKREAQPYSMLAAALFAATDIARLRSLPRDPEQTVEAIVHAARTHYAAPATSKLLQKYAKTISLLIGKCSEEVRAHLAGPLWVGPKRYAELESDRLVESDELHLMILEDGRLVVRI